MTLTLLDFSQQLDLTLHAQVVADVEALAAPMSVSTMIVGAFARDLHLVYGYKIDARRQTDDLDFALAVPHWNAFEVLRKALVSSNAFVAPDGSAHRLLHRGGLPIDLVPFGKVETADRKIAWPPSADVVMDVFGFEEALANACDVLLPGNVKAKVVSLPALALLKLICWQDRHYRSPQKDAHDLYLIMRNYLAAGNEDRLWGEFIEWTQAADFRYEHAEARMLGRDMRTLLGRGDVDRVSRLIAQQADPENPARLPNEMDRHDPDRAGFLLTAMLEGLLEV